MKKLFKEIKKCNNCDLVQLSKSIGMGSNSLARSIRNDAIKVSTLKKCIELSGEKMIVVFKGENYEV